MKRAYAYLLGMTVIGISLLLEQSCTKNGSTTDTLIGNWIRSSDFDGYARSEAAGFTIGDYTYLTTGSTDRDRFKDLWEYNLARKYWSQKADFPGGARNSAVAFATGGKGYVGTGYDGVNYLKDFWEYDPSADQWTQKADFGGSGRYDAIAFSVGGKGYVGSGYDGNYLKDLWQYDPDKDQWMQKASIGDFKRTASVAFVINDVAYVCSGNNNGQALNDLWMYDAANDTWIGKRKISNVSDESYDDNYTSIARYNAAVFIMDNKAYLSTGVSASGSLVSDTWEYDPSTDLWTKKTAFEGTARQGAVGFTLSDRGFILTGRSGSQSFDNSYEFHPNEEYNAND